MPSPTTVATRVDDATPSSDAPRSLFAGAESENVNVRIEAIAGGQSAGTPIRIEASQLIPLSTVRVTVYSEPLVILEGIVDENGAFSGTTSLPPGLDSGSHTLVLEAVAATGPISVAGAFLLESDGTFARIAQPEALVALEGPNDERLARALEAGRPVWDPDARPLTSALIAVTAMSMIALAGAGGIATGLGGGASSQMSTQSQGQGSGQGSDGSPTNSADNDSQDEEKTSRGKLATVVTKKLKGINVSSTARGDVSGSWAMPATVVTDQFSREAANRAGKISAAASRVLVDGAWLRAMFGSAGYSTWIAGMVLGGLASFIDTDSPLTPTAPWLVAIVFLGILDAGAGASAWLTMSVIACATGSVGSLADVRTILGLFVLLATLALLAHVIRPLRRFVTGNRFELWERVFDYVMMPVFVAFAAGSMLKALNGLSGLEIVSNQDVVTLRWVVGVAIIVRLATEDVAAHWYPERMKQVQPSKLVSPGKPITAVSIVLRALVFIMICEPFFGVGATTLSAAALLAVPQILKMWEDDLPNYTWLNRWFPRGLFRFFCTLVLGAFLTVRLIGPDGGADAVRSSFIWLLLPGVLIGVVELFGRSGGVWPNVALRRALGAVVWLGAAAMVTGQLTLFS